MALPPFHAAILVHDLDAARAFYGELLGCTEGRCSDGWVDFNLYDISLYAIWTLQLMLGNRAPDR